MGNIGTMDYIGLTIKLDSLYKNKNKNAKNH